MSRHYNPAGHQRRPEAPQNTAPVVQTAPAVNQRAEEARATRRRRESLNEDDRARSLYVPKEALDPNFEYRWINDTAAGRVMNKTVYDDWDIVTKEELKGFVDSAKDAGVGTNVSRLVGVDHKGGGMQMQAVLVKKPKAYYEEDKAKEQARIDAQEEDLRRQVPVGDKNVDQRVAYIPDGRNKIG